MRCRILLRFSDKTQNFFQILWCGQRAQPCSSQPGLALYTLAHSIQRLLPCPTQVAMSVLVRAAHMLWFSQTPDLPSGNVPCDWTSRWIGAGRLGR